jgi:hypothetical protein
MITVGEIGPVTEILTLTVAFAASLTITDVNPLAVAVMLRVAPEIDAVAIVVSGLAWMEYGAVPPERVAFVFPLGATESEVELDVKAPAGGGLVVSSLLQPLIPVATTPTIARQQKSCMNRFVFIEQLLENE